MKEKVAAQAKERIDAEANERLGRAGSAVAGEGVRADGRAVRWIRR